MALKIPRLFICITLLVMKFTALYNSLGGATNSSPIVPILVASSSSLSLKKEIESPIGEDEPELPAIDLVVATVVVVIVVSDSTAETIPVSKAVVVCFVRDEFLVAELLFIVAVGLRFCLILRISFNFLAFPRRKSG